MYQTQEVGESWTVSCDGGFHRTEGFGAFLKGNVKLAIALTVSKSLTDIHALGTFDVVWLILRIPSILYFPYAMVIIPTKYLYLGLPLKTSAVEKKFIVFAWTLTKTKDICSQEHWIAPDSADCDFPKLPLHPVK